MGCGVGDPPIANKFNKKKFVKTMRFIKSLQQKLSVKCEV
jgi:hypothetical protein